MDNEHMYEVKIVQSVGCCGCMETLLCYPNLTRNFTRHLDGSWVGIGLLFQWFVSHRSERGWRESAGNSNCSTSGEKI